LYNRKCVGEGTDEKAHGDRRRRVRQFIAGKMKKAPTTGLK
jgi:hypothetical protein